MGEYYSFLYLDRKSIKNLYPQVFGDIIEKNITRSRECGVESSMKANALGILNADLKGDKSVASSENIKTVKRTAVKAQELINLIRNEEDTRDIKDIKYIQDIIESKKAESSFLFIGKAAFLLSDIYENGENICWIDKSFIEGVSYITINDKSVFVLESGRTDFVDKNSSAYHDTDTYLLNRNCRYGIIMHVSRVCMEKDIYALFTNFKRGELTRLYVFGQLIKCSKTLYKIDPYAIWT